jgi:hypothetical protein
MRILDFDNKDITIRQAHGKLPLLVVNANTLTILTIRDTGKSIVAYLMVDGKNMVKVLWENQAYSPIDNWTQEQVNTRILELI